MAFLCGLSSRVAGLLYIGSQVSRELCRQQVTSLRFRIRADTFFLFRQIQRGKVHTRSEFWDVWFPEANIILDTMSVGEIFFPTPQGSFQVIGAVKYSAPEPVEWLIWLLSLWKITKHVCFLRVSFFCRRSSELWVGKSVLFWGSVLATG